MNTNEKPDASGFRKYIRELKNLTPHIWPEYLFHLTHITNAARILTYGELLSRNEACTRGVVFDDSASQDVLQQTAEYWKSFVRFYFRPRTPMLYLIEGFCPASKQPVNAKCPVPIYLLFDLKNVICSADSLFSDGNLASSNVKVSQSLDDFKQIPFEKVYHEGPYSQEQSDIKHYRQAEVIVPNAISLDNLRGLWCRSEAEWETLRHLLPADIWTKWKNKITYSAQHELFYRRWVYVERVTLEGSNASFYFNQSGIGLFNLDVQIIDLQTAQRYI